MDSLFSKVKNQILSKPLIYQKIKKVNRTKFRPVNTI